MMAKTGMLLLAAASGAALSIPHERVAGPEGFGWTKRERVPPGELLEFTIALKHTPAQKAWLKSTIDAVSNPSDPRYGQYVSVEQMTAKMAVPEATAKTVLSAFEGAGFTEVELLPSGDFVRAYATHAVASPFFNTEFCRWESEKVNVTRACSTVYHLPEEVSSVVDVVSGLVHFPLASFGAKPVARAPTAAGDVIKTIRAAYNMTGVAPSTNKSTSCFTQFLGQWYNPSDLQAFFKKENPPQEGQVITKQVGPFQAGYGTEAELDAQYLTTMGNGVDTWVWSNQNKNAVNNQEPWLEFFTNVSSATAYPLVMSVSYGEGEYTLTPDYIERSNVEVQKIGVRGITIIFASGDNGAGCHSDHFNANFPAALPYGVAVGGTASCAAGTGVAGFSSGGFSDQYPTQAWQKTVVEEYLKKTTTDAKYYNASGRGYPDVAACGEVQICVRGICGVSVSGTSCAAPIFSGVMGLVNDARLAAGKPSLGFAAPALYAAYAADASSFTDITTGTTSGCVGLHASWEATTGWDPTSGLGTPNYPRLLAQLMK